MKNRKEKSNLKNYFLLSNEIFTIGLSASEIAVYAFLLSCEDRKTFKCHPSYKTIGRATKMTTNTVRKHVCSLEEKCLIETAPTSVISHEGRKQNGNLMYTIKPIMEALELYHSVSFDELERLKVAEKLRENQKEESA